MNSDINYEGKIDGAIVKLLTLLKSWLIEMNSKFSRPFLLKKEFFPVVKDGQKELSYFRDRLFIHRKKNLEYLIKKRYDWMEDYIRPNEAGLEIGAGIGAAKLVLPNYNFSSTDCYPHPWIDGVEDGMNLTYDSNSLDYIIASNVIHHMPFPMKFFDESYRTLRPGGKILLNEVNSGLLMRLILRLANHEGYSYDKNPFDTYVEVTSSDQPWSGNNAVANMLFADANYFESKTGFKVIFNRPCEFFIFLLSGGVSSEFYSIEMPNYLLSLFDKVDKLLARFPAIFPLSRKILLVKNG